MKSAQIFLIIQIVLIVILGVFALLKTRTVSETVLAVRESLGQPSEEYVMPNFSLQIPEADTVIFVCMTSVPSRFANVPKVLASLPQDQRIRKIVVLPQTQKNSTAIEDTSQDETLIHKLHVHDRIQFLRTSRDMGPFLKTWAISDPATAARLGAVRTENSKHIFITLDDDMQQHQDLIQSLVNKVIETGQKEVIAVETRKALRNDGNPQTQLVGRSGVAYPARIWTSAFRGDVRDCFMMAPCMQDDDASISYALMRNEVPITKLGGTKQWAIPSSIAFAKKNVNLKSALCEDALGKMPIL